MEAPESKTETPAQKRLRGRPKGRLSTLPLYLPPPLKERVAEAAGREGRSQSGFVLRVLQQYLDENL